MVEKKSVPSDRIPVILDTDIGSDIDDAVALAYLLRQPACELVGVTAIGCTHAWAEIFLPGAGWITFDPTNRSVGGANLIAIAVGRGIRQVTPVEGAFVGPTNTLLGLWVEVSISPIL